MKNHCIVFIYLVFLFHLNQSFASPNPIKKCDTTQTPTVDLAYELAEDYLINAHAIINHADARQRSDVQYGLKRFFKVDVSNPKQQKIINKIFRVINHFYRRVSKTRFQCARKIGPWCDVGILAIVPPPMNRIYLCPSFFNRDLATQVGTVIHEWGHQFGFILGLGYINETYCWEGKEMSAKQLARQPDSYMQMIYWLGSGQDLGCFKIHR